MIFAVFRRVLQNISVVLVLVSFPSQADAKANMPDYRFKVHTSVWTTHFNPKPEHNNTQRLLGFEWYGKYFDETEWQQSRDWLDRATPFVGGAWFRNSFNQRTLYAYTGFRQDLKTYGNGVQTYAKLTGGFLHGYRDQYRDRVPMNKVGTSPAIVPMFGLHHDSTHLELVVFGASGIMINIGRSF